MTSKQRIRVVVDKHFILLPSPSSRSRDVGDPGLKKGTRCAIKQIELTGINNRSRSVAVCKNNHLETNQPWKQLETVGRKQAHVTRYCEWKKASEWSARTKKSGDEAAFESPAQTWHHPVAWHHSGEPHNHDQFSWQHCSSIVTKTQVLMTSRQTLPKWPHWPYFVKCLSNFCHVFTMLMPKKSEDGWVSWRETLCKFVRNIFVSKETDCTMKIWYWRLRRESSCVIGVLTGPQTLA